MSHEQMLAWLNQANAGTVQSAALKLESAAEEIAKIAEELGRRPDRVEWKGEGADAFRYWSSDLANATWRLSEFSKGASGWLNQASDSIALAQSAIPRDTPTAQANIDAAYAAHNDPDAPAVRAKYAQNLAELAADQEKVRQEAAAQMTKLAQSYAWSATQMNALERPKFPPPPEAFVPDADQTRDGSQDMGRGGGSAGVNSLVGGSAVVGSAAISTSTFSPRHVSSIPATQPHVPEAALPPARTSIDSVSTLPTQTPVEAPRAPVAPGSVRDTTPSGSIPPLPGGGQALPVNNQVLQGRAFGTGRIPMPSVGEAASTTTPFGRAPSVSGGNGIIGGRPVLPSEGRPTGAIPRGTVVGGEGTPARSPMGPMGQTPNMATNPVGRAMSTPGTTPSGRPASSPGGIVGGHPASNSGVVRGGSVQQSGRGGARVPGSRAIGSNGTASERSGEGRGAAGTASRLPQTPPQTPARSGSSRPYGVTEDEETWQRNHRPTVPPVVD
ncbi:translation initiation factor IF-2 [Streptomyces acidiscabies]|uniref:translation initiation factor IF-2 n=1 Tax=Streptomyces acidiscabies TaxID=42234 RepID=UPI00131A8535|nr:translation initiation factor IF-2 [Streptomyces acidiscabies]